MCGGLHFPPLSVVSLIRISLPTRSFTATASGGGGIGIGRVDADVDAALSGTLARGL